MADLVADEALQHHHEAPCPLAQGAVGVLLQESEQLGPDLGQHGGHVVPGQRVAVVQVHHCVLQVAAQRRHVHGENNRRKLCVHVMHIILKHSLTRLALQTGGQSEIFTL